MVDEDSQVSLENLRIEIPGTGGVIINTKRDIFLERDKDIEDKEG